MKNSEAKEGKTTLTTLTDDKICLLFGCAQRISSNNIERRGEGKAEFTVNFCKKGFFRDENLLRKI